MPKVFVSYSYDSGNHKKWVLELASKLRSNGVDVVFDQFETRLGSDLALFMEQGLNESARVICVCSELYNEKANSGVSGVGYEKRIICKELLKDSSAAWVIPLIRNNGASNKLPLFLSALKYISFEDDEAFGKNFYELLRDLHDQSNLPPLGKNPFEHSADVIGKVEEVLSIKRSLSFSVSSNGTVRFNYLSNSGVHTFGSGIYEFKTHWSSRGGKSIYAYSDGVKAIAWAPSTLETNSLNLEDHDFSSRVRHVSSEEKVIWINTNGKILVTIIKDIEQESSQNEWVEVEYEILEDHV